MPQGPHDKRETKNVLITGHPGCGKTALVKRLLDKIATSGFNYFQEKHGINKPFSFINPKGAQEIHYFRTLDVNGMRVKSMANLLETVQKFVGNSQKCRKIGNESLTTTEKIKIRIRETPNVLYILFIDEIDHIYNKLLLSSTREDFFDLFRLANLNPLQNFLIISAANLIDFKMQFTKKSVTEEIPALESIVFEPYTKEQICEIVHDKLKEPQNGLSLPPCFSAQTLRHATVTIVHRENGDLRKVYGALKCIVEGKISALQGSKVGQEGLGSLDEMISFEEISETLEKRYSKGQDSIIMGLSQYHQITLVSCLLQLRKKSSTPVDDLLQSLNAIAHEIGFENISRDKLMEILSVLSNYSFVSVKEPEKKGLGFKGAKKSVFQQSNETTVTLQIKAEELKEALSKFALYKEFIE